MTPSQSRMPEALAEDYAMLGLETDCSPEQLQLARQIAQQHWRAQAESKDPRRRSTAELEMAAVQKAVEDICRENDWPQDQIEAPLREGLHGLLRPITIQGTHLAMLGLLILLMLAGLGFWLSTVF